MCLTNMIYAVLSLCEENCLLYDGSDINFTLALLYLFICNGTIVCFIFCGTNWYKVEDSWP